MEVVVLTTSNRPLAELRWHETKEKSAIRQVLLHLHHEYRYVGITHDANFGCYFQNVGTFMFHMCLLLWHVTV
jgi:hypothetical protein